MMLVDSPRSVEMLALVAREGSSSYGTPSMANFTDGCHEGFAKGEAGAIILGVRSHCVCEMET